MMSTTILCCSSLILNETVAIVNAAAIVYCSVASHRVSSIED